MKTPLSDDELRQRVRELGRREADSAPSWDRVFRGRRPTSAGWLRAALALAGVLLVAAVAWWWPISPEGPVVSPLESASNDQAEEWVLPTDGLLADTWDGTGRSEVERLSREIEGLLQP